MSSTLESGLKTYDWATDSTQSFVTGMNDNSAILDKSIKWNDQVKREFYKQMCKDITSADGNDVTVNNGMNGYVLSGEVKGRTVKNYFTKQTAYPTNLLSADFIVNNYNPQRDLFKANTQYTIILDIECSEGAKINFVYHDTADDYVHWSGMSVVNGVNKITISHTKDFRLHAITKWRTTATVLILKSNVVVVDETQKDMVSYPNFIGLNSTTAQVTNNGITYPFYLTEADKTNKKPILLGGVNGVYDTLTLNEDGSGILVQNTKQITVQNGNYTYIDYTNNRMWVILQAGIFKNFAKAICDKFETTNAGYEDINNRNKVYMNSNGDVRFLTDKAITDISNIFPLNVLGELATPIVTQIPKELMPVILTQLSNQFKVGDTVKASSYTLKVPTSDGVKSETNLTLLNGYIAVANSLTPVCRLTKDNRVEITLDCTSPSTFNATVTSIPLNMRPLKDVRIIGFVDGVATPVTIKTTGEVQLPNSIVSKNVYIKDTYRLNAN